MRVENTSIRKYTVYFIGIVLDHSTMFSMKTRIKLAARIELGPSKVDVMMEDNSSHYMVDKPGHVR